MSTRTPAQKKAIAAAIARKNAAASAAPKRSYAAPSRRTYAVRGHGDYWTDVKKRWGTGGGSMKGAFETAGKALGGPVGGALGGLLNRGLYALTGFGDYTVKHNTLLETNGPPSVINSGKEFIIRHREYIGDIYSASGPANTPSGFVNQVYPINPGNSSTFPWLATVADRFEQYRIQGMVFEYKSLYSDAVVTQNGSIGSIVLATEYNAGSPPFMTKQQMENYEFAQSSKPSLSILHPIECAKSQSTLTELYVLRGTVPEGEDVKTYNFGDFQIASQGIPLGAAGAAVNLGELWVTYEIALLKPKIDTGALPDSGYAKFLVEGTYTGLFSSAVPAPQSVIIRDPATNLDVSQTADNTFVFRLQSFPRKIAICATWASEPQVNSAGANWRAPGFNFTNATILGNFMSRGAPGISSQISTGCISQYYVLLPAATASLPTCTMVITNSGNYDNLNALYFQMVINSMPDDA